MTRLLFLVTPLVLFLCSACTTLLLKEDFSAHPLLVSDGGLIGSIPGEPDGDRIATVDPTVAMTTDGTLPGRSLSIQNRIDFEPAAHTEDFDKYLITWSGFQENRSAANTRIEFINEDDEVVLRLHFTPNQLEVIADEDGPPPVFPYASQFNNTHKITVVINVQGTNGSTSYADITIREDNGAEQKWGRMQLIGNRFGKLSLVRFRANAGGAYNMDGLAVNGID